MHIPHPLAPRIEQPAIATTFRSFSSVLPDPSPRPSLHRPRLLRGSDPREPRHRPARSRAVDLRAADHRRRRVGFRTRVITEGVTLPLHIDYKRSRIKQYHKEGHRTLRTETTINDPHDFDIGKRLSNLPALRRIGFQANRRLLDVQRISQDCTGRRRVPRGQ